MIFKMLKGLNAILEKIAFSISSTLVALIVTALFLSAATRFVSGNGYDWLIELPPVLICWLVFPLLGPLLKAGQHINVNVVNVYLSENNKNLVRLFINFVVLLSSLIFFKAGFDATKLYHKMGQILEIQLTIPVWWMYLAFPTGFLILFLFALELLIKDFATVFNGHLED